MTDSAVPRVSRSGTQLAFVKAQLDEFLFGLAVIVGFVGLMEPRHLWGRYSILESALAVLVLSLVAWRYSPRRPRVPLLLPLGGLLLLMAASALWSYASWETVRDVTTYAILALGAWVIVRSARLQTVVLAIVVAGALVLGASTALLLVSPADALFYETSGFQGIYGNRNTLAFVMTLALPAALTVRVSGWLGAIAKFAAATAFLIAIGFTLSKSSWIVAAVVVLSWIGLGLLRRRRAAGILFFGVLALGAALAMANFSRVLLLLGKSDTINGRTGIWTGVLDAIAQRPIVGFGWSRSWPAGSPHSERVSQELAAGHVVFHAHNELLNWLVTLGVLGAVLVLVLYVFAVCAGIRIWWGNQQAVFLWLPITAVAVIARGFSDISETNAQGWFVFMLVLASCAKYLPVDSRIARSRVLLSGRSESAEPGAVPRP
ncbi:O-antigen ligase family protein [Salinibacterium sp. dk2585]|uniref:O-antigen ligase family protein n=1 Tax=unclassified Salinibacterium TaxID=2632331 RepID=UPI0011C24BB7|nr:MULTISPECIES: O-antigen ligase family protein [unclassified Salinibacterium]QEE60838.1 O-antigen ligase family protein [Salinibacterium sp. dk2585]TXK55910.1 O-antigen ligase family protein [Salinibacterium sp. dk5596]